VSLIEATDEQISEYEALSRQVRAERRSVRVRSVGGALSLPADTRQRVRIEVDKTSVLADNTETVTLTVTALKADGTVRNALTRSVDFETMGGRVIRLDFVNGVATRQIRMPASGRWRIQSNDDIAVETDVEIVAAE